MHKMYKTFNEISFYGSRRNVNGPYMQDLLTKSVYLVFRVGNAGSMHKMCGRLKVIYASN
jgi:hypothetical protein